MVITVQPATESDVDDLVEFGAKLFAEDAAVHDTYIDLTWSEREGHADVAQLMSSDDGLVLIAKDDGTAIGHLVGYCSPASSTRQPVRFAVLRSMYLLPSHRRGGVGRELVRQFRRWAAAQDCVEAHVSAYVANQPAQQFYQALGFEARSVSHVLSL